MLNSKYFDDEDKEELGYDPSTPAGQAEMDMAEIAKQREREGLPPD